MKTSDCSILLLLMFYISSCSVLKAPSENDQRISLERGNISQVSGKYNRFPNVSDSPRSNASDLFWGFFITGYNHKSGDYVNLKVIDERHIDVSLISEKKVIAHKVLKGKIRHINRLVNW